MNLKELLNEGIQSRTQRDEIRLNLTRRQAAAAVYAVDVLIDSIDHGNDADVDLETALHDVRRLIGNAINAPSPNA